MTVPVLNQDSSRSRMKIAVFGIGRMGKRHARNVSF